MATFRTIKGLLNARLRARSFIVYTTLAALSLCPLHSAMACRSQRAYPVCQYNGPAPTQIILLQKTVTEMLKSDPKARFVSTPDSKWITIYAKNSFHKRIGQTWPAFGCLGSYSSDVSHAKYSACLTTVKDLLQKADVTVTGSRSDSLVEPVVLFCNGT